LIKYGTQKYVETNCGTLQRHIYSCTAKCVARIDIPLMSRKIYFKNPAIQIFPSWYKRVQICVCIKSWTAGFFVDCTRSPYKMKNTLRAHNFGLTKLKTRYVNLRKILRRYCHINPHCVYVCLYYQSTPHHGISFFLQFTSQPVTLCFIIHFWKQVLKWKIELKGRSWFISFTKRFMPVCWHTSRDWGSTPLFQYCHCHWTVFLQILYQLQSGRSNLCRLLRRLLISSGLSFFILELP
jgi:hypothetical protein